MPHYASSRIGITSLALAFALGSAATVAPSGCGTTTTGTTDGATPADATMMATADLTGAAGDLAMDTCAGTETFTAAHDAMLSTCGGKSMCHNAQPFGAGLDLTRARAYKAIVDVMAAVTKKTLVKPGDADNSFLYQKLTNTQGKLEGLPMPKGDGLMWTPPDPAKLKILRCWIQNGAKDN